MQSLRIIASRIAVPATLIWLLAFTGCGRDTMPTSTPRPVVSVVTVVTQRLNLTTELSGRTAPYRIAEIRPQVSGMILKRLFDEGTDVRAGQVLYRIDRAPYQAALDNALAAMARAEANRTAIRLRKGRFEALLPDHAVSQQDFDDAVAGLAQADAEVEVWKAQVEAARINLDYTDIKAPISGRIGRSGVTEGAIVTAYQPQYLAKVQQLDPIYLDMPESTTEMLRLRRHLADGSLDQGGADQNKIQLVQEDGTAYPHKGLLQFRDVTVDPTTGSVVIRSLFPNPDGLLLPDMFVRGIVAEGTREHAILIPLQGVARDPKGDPYAWIVDTEGRAQIRELVLERTVGDQWLVSAGLEPGDRLIVEGSLSLKVPGTDVETVPFEPASISTDLAGEPIDRSRPQEAQSD